MIRLLFVSVLLLSFTSNAQLNLNLRSQVSHTEFYADSIVDNVFGIDIYEPLNLHLSADSVRLCDRYLCSGWIVDMYTDSTMLHRGFYVEGQLQIYKNYYPDGTLERDFKVLDEYRSSLRLYFPNGQLKSKAEFANGFAKEWTDYYENGNLKFVEKYNRKMTFHTEKASYFASGQTKDELVLENKKKLVFVQNEYFENGQVKVTGKMIFNENSYAYERTGEWKYFDESGKKTKIQTWDEGDMTNEKTF